MYVYRYKHSGLIVGVDEAGRGPLAGPVYAAAVILPEDFTHPLLDDSKKITYKKRLILRDFIIKAALSWAVASIDNQEIDKINILNATIKAMHKALDRLNQKPDLIIIDGNRFKKYKDIEHKTIVAGDSKYACIAAASILAKTFRDEYMEQIHKLYPQYNWLKNKGYGTFEHRQAILKYGLSPFHRKKFCTFYYQKKLNI